MAKRNNRRKRITRRKGKGGDLEKKTEKKTEKNHPEDSAAADEPTAAAADEPTAAADEPTAAADEPTATDGEPSILGNMASIASKTLTTAAIPIAKTVAEKALGVNPMFQTMFNTKEKEEILTSLHNVKEPEDIVEFIKKIAQIFIVKFFTVILPPLRIFVKTVNPSEKMLKRLLLIQLMVVESTPPVSASVTAFQGIQLMADGMCKPLGLDNPIPSINTINNTTAEIISTKIPLEDLKSDKPNEQIITEIEEDLQKTIKDILDGKLLDPIGTIKHEIISILVGPLLDKLKSEFKTDKPDADAIEKLLTEQLDIFKSDPKSPIGSLLDKAEKASAFAKQSGIPSFDLDEEINKMKKSIAATIFEKIKSIPDINTLENDKLIEMLIEQLDGNDETNAPSPPTSGETVPPTSGETAAPTSGETVPPASGETAAPASGETVPPASGETVPPTSGETVPPASGETAAPTSGETVPPASGETAAPTSGESVTPSIAPASGETVPPAPPASDKPTSTSIDDSLYKPNVSANDNNAIVTDTTKDSYVAKLHEELENTPKQIVEQKLEKVCNSTIAGTAANWFSPGSCELKKPIVQSSSPIEPSALASAAAAAAAAAVTAVTAVTAVPPAVTTAVPPAPATNEPSSKEMPGGSRKKRRKTKKSIRKSKKKNNKKSVKKSKKKSHKK